MDLVRLVREEALFLLLILPLGLLLAYWMRLRKGTKWGNLPIWILLNCLWTVAAAGSWLTLAKTVRVQRRFGALADPQWSTLKYVLASTSVILTVLTLYCWIRIARRFFCRDRMSSG